jgi:hypothetical protein
LIAGLSAPGIDSEFATVFFTGSVVSQSGFLAEVPATTFVDGFTYTPNQSTYIPSAVDACVAKSANHAQKFLITVTDGVGGDVTASTTSASSGGWTLIGVGVGSGTDATTMNLLSGGNSALLFNAIGFNNLAAIVAQINEQVNCM